MNNHYIEYIVYFT